VRDTDHGQCLTDEVLTDYLEGGLNPLMKAAAEVHLVSCQNCRNQLAFFMRVLEPTVTSEEANTLERIAAEWDRRNPERVAPQPSRSSKGLRRLLIGAGALAALVVVGVAAWTIRQSMQPHSATEVVQLLLDQDRPFESRMAGARHRAFLQTRSANDLDISYDLLAGEMSRLSANSQEMGRFYLLQKDFSRAIPYLEAAERDSGADAAVHNDLGVAYLESGKPAEIEKGGAEFRHALQLDPSFVPAAFNLALFYERTNAPVRAETQWKQYLELDSKSDWAMEVQGRLQGLSR